MCTEEERTDAICVFVPKSTSEAAFWVDAGRWLMGEIDALPLADQGEKP